MSNPNKRTDFASEQWLTSKSMMDFDLASISILYIFVNILCYNKISVTDNAGSTQLTKNTQTFKLQFYTADNSVESSWFCDLVVGDMAQL